MKAFALISILFFSSVSFATSKYDVCESIISSSDQSQCMDIVRNNEYQESALNVCIEIISPSSKNNCMMAIANKSFDLQVLNVCDGIISPSSKVNCLKKEGADFERARSCSQSQAKLEAIEELAHSILDDIQYMNLYSAGEKLLRIIDIATAI